MQTEVEQMTKAPSVLLMNVVHFRPVYSPDKWPKQSKGREVLQHQNQQTGSRRSRLYNNSGPTQTPPTGSWIMEQKKETMFESEYFLICIINIQYSLRFPT